MAGGREYSKHQEGIIRRYYDNRDTIASGRLSELVSELYLATGDAQRDRLWKRVAKALGAARADPARVERVLEARDIERLATLVADIDAGKAVKKDAPRPKG